MRLTLRIGLQLAPTGGELTGRAKRSHIRVPFHKTTAIVRIGSAGAESTDQSIVSVRE
ncbi:hypothetical protein [Brevibacillus reuszeri]|uniref:hypothetical protein n=1 Tax=Brevibacillus reuszeri TaxID=54915 RepID=UPI0013E00C06|nr:hypothetical protein [Brevibacillus reuszeri]